MLGHFSKALDVSNFNRVEECMSSVNKFCQLRIVATFCVFLLVKK